MSYELSYETPGEYLIARVSGPYDPVEGRELLKGVREQARQNKLTHILLDATKVGAPSSDIDRYLMGELFADLFPVPFKVAVLFTATQDKFMENTAVVRGTSLLVCADEGEATRWLLAPDNREV